MAVDYSKMTTSELEAAALSGEQQEEKPERDDKGRFAKGAEEKPDAAQEADEIVYERVIDLGDGSGTQVFRGATLEELVDNLAKAQENASRKIRELSSAQKAAIKVVEEEKGLTDDERFILSQRILTEPDKVIDAFIDKAIAKKVGPRLAKVDDIERREREETARVEFVENTPDYYAAPRNGARMFAWMQTHGYEHTVENLQKAFEDLNASGLLEARPQEKQDAENDADETKPERIVPAKVETVVRRKVVGGLSTKRQAQVAAKSSEPTESDLRKMPIDQLEAETLRWLNANG